MDKPKLLIVDDDESIQLAMKWAFAQEFEILLAGDRQEALKYSGAAPAAGDARPGASARPAGVEEGFLTPGSACWKKTLMQR